MNRSDYKKITETYFPFWKHLSNQEQETLLQNISLVTYPKGTTIHNGNQDCIGVLLVKSGTLRTYMLSEEGREITLYRLYKGDICILSASCILQSITFDVQINAETDCETIQISSAVFSELSNHNVYVENFSYQLAADRFSDVMWTMQQILFMSFDKRLAVFLDEELGKTEDDTIRLTHEQVAKYMGSAREVVSRMLKYFSDEGIVQLSRGGIRVIDKKKLHQISRT